MIIVDDHLTLLVVAGIVGNHEFGDDLVTTSLWYLRLVSAITAPSIPGRGQGRLTRILGALPDADRDAAIARILSPPVDTVEVLHPMRFAAEMARAQREQQLNLLAAETVGAALHHGASIIVAAPNAGGPIERAAQYHGISYTARTS